MGGSATLGTNLIDSLITDVVDGLRGSLHPAFGVRAFRVYTVLRTWDGAAIGEGNATEVETELTPQPWVLPYHMTLEQKLEPCGLDEAGHVILREVSLTYTEAELTGGSSLAANAEWAIRIKDAHGQATLTRDFLIDSPPYPDRMEDIGWKVRLRSA